METNVIYNEDCVEGMKERLSDNSIDLIVNDPPYNIGKDEWDKIENYIEWCSKWLHQCERILKPSGSFYFFHNDFNILAELHNLIKENTSFAYKNLIIWDKYTKFRTMQAGGGPLCGTLQQDGLRNYRQFTEFVLFYTLQKNDTYPVRKIRKYLREEIKKAKGEINLNKINKALGTAANGGGVASSTLSLEKTNPSLITKDKYQKLQKWVGNNYLNKSYKELKKEFNDKRYTFNNQKTDHSATVWHYPYSNETEHKTEKPVKLIENIIKHSSNEGDVVLDCFGGSGTTAKACQNLNRQYILFETNEDYVKLTKDRLRQQSLFEQAK